MARMENTTGQTLVKCKNTEDGNYSEITQHATHRLKQRKDSGQVNTLAALECSYEEVESHEGDHIHTIIQGRPSKSCYICLTVH